MARKTNKTDHVLNLLSSGSDKDNTEESKTVKPQPPVEPDKAASVSVVQPSSDKEQLADAIRLSLEEELEKVQEKEEKEEIAAEGTEQEMPSNTDDINEEAAEEERPEVDSKDNGSEPEPGEDLDFAYVNVMETLVQERVLEYMEQFGICTCPRCIADTSALALTQLPPKYVVVSKAAISPLMNFYSKKYAGQITVEITKACIQVGDVPHHTRN
ncbi:late competence development ComFB family protein [Extibacter muris]|uniref:late competence development ComFB family protein n=1 Tax=Extibacter muris TaxID=1796622 RepID=UPI001D08D31F|nr:late competence development ComFB family protein [Extibacter muris]MCB6201412.1 late competence development ComFB family protein [Extibacter muris]MCQ4662738.1 late competence development ComFB family protein [Extibacter muris]MCQ4694147.1 late competence development ComFB family protein [Extibacter muris]